MLVINTSFVSAAIEIYPWNANVGDTFQWNLFDDYYTITSILEKGTHLSGESNHTNTNCYARYDLVKEWYSDDLDLYIKTTNPDVKSIVIVMTYFPIVIGMVQYNRTYNITYGNQITTTLPRIVDPNNVPTNVEVTWMGTGVFNINIQEPINLKLDVLPTSQFNTFGQVEIYFLDQIGGRIDEMDYMYYYVASPIYTSPFKLYARTGMKIEIVNTTEMPQEMDNKTDLLVMVTNTLNIVEGLDAETPSYTDINIILDLLTAIISLLNLAGAGESLGSLFGGNTLPLNFGFSIPSGMRVMYSDAADVINSLYGYGGFFIDSVLVPLLLGGLPNVDELLAELLAISYSPTFLLSAITLLSITNYLIFPTNVDFMEIKNGFDYLSERIQDIQSIIEISDERTMDIGSILYLLKNLISTDLTNNILTISINNFAFPSFFDTQKAFTSIGMKIAYNVQKYIIDEISFTIDCPTAGFGHCMGIKYKDSKFGTQSGLDAWFGSIKNILLVIGGILGTLGTVKVKKKRDIKKVTPFKGFISNCPEDNPYCNYDNFGR